MDIYNHFSCYTNLPVRLEGVIAHVKEAGVVDDILFFAIDMDPALLRGMCWIFTDKPRNGSERKVAWIAYSSRLTREMARLTICKELLHLLDTAGEAAGDETKVRQLVDEIVLPMAAHVALPTMSDHNGELRALVVLMPACAIELFRDKLATGAVSFETLARLARLPEEHVRLTFSPVWERILQLFGVEPAGSVVTSTAEEQHGLFNGSGKTEGDQGGRAN